MAIDLCSENPSVSTSTSSTSMGMSPRISFSHDLSQSDISIPDEQRLLRSISASTVDFDFCIHHNFNHESTTSAEELFSDGKILPTQLVNDKNFTPKSHEQKESPPTSPPLPLQPPPPPPHDHHHGGGKCSENSDATTTKPVILSEPEPEDQKQKSKSFWQFKRSSSLNCGNGYARSLCPLPLLSRSNSTGSASTNSKKSSSSSSSSSSSRDALNHKQQQQKTPLVAAPIKQSQFLSNGYQKPPLKKNGSGYGASHGNGVRINPVLNVPPANLFGLGSIFFSNNKDKTKKK